MLSLNSSCKLPIQGEGAGEGEGAALSQGRGTVAIYESALCVCCQCVCLFVFGCFYLTFLMSLRLRPHTNATVATLRLPPTRRVATLFCLRLWQCSVLLLRAGSGQAALLSHLQVYKFRYLLFILQKFFC